MDTDHNVDMMWKNKFNTGPYGKKQKLANFNLIVETMMSLYPYLMNTHQEKLYTKYYVWWIFMMAAVRL